MQHVYRIEKRIRSCNVLRVLRWCLSLLLMGACLLPWSARLRKPSVVLDDVSRIAALQTLSLPERLCRPFNEHLSPWIDVVSTLTWQLAGRKLETAPLAFCLSAGLPYLLTQALLWMLVRRALDSRTSAWVAVAIFASTPVYAECVYWYSAASFTWALLFTFWGLSHAASVDSATPPKRRNLLMALLCSCLAPMASGIGLLAGPAAAVQIGLARPGRRFPRVNPRCLWPLAGTCLYLLLATAFRHQDVLARSIRSNGSIGPGLIQATQAPAYLVLRCFGGVLEPRSSLPATTLGVISLGLACLGVLGHSRAPENRRRLIRASGIMIVGGYLLIYMMRARVAGPESLLSIERYHLFPTAGLTLMMVTLLADPLSRLDARPTTGLGLSLVVALVLLQVNGHARRESLNFFDLQTDQRPALRALDRLGAAAQAMGLARSEILEALGSIEPRWSFNGGNILEMLPRMAHYPRLGTSADENRARLLASLEPRDRAALLSCVDLTHRLVAMYRLPEDLSRVPISAVSTSRLRSTGRPGHFESLGWPACLEYAIPPQASAPVGIEFRGLSRSTTWEFWWTTETSDWSTDRVALLRLCRTPALAQSWILPLAAVPAMEQERLARVRLIARETGPVSLEQVTLIR